MTKQERLIVSAYTGILMVDINEFHEYIETEVLKRPVFIHEFEKEEVIEEIVNAVSEDFIKLCYDEDEHEGVVS